ncbi:hypothetical protein EBQ74_01020 [bacterium]|nr:hypothetical protein [bacterium]
MKKALEKRDEFIGKHYGSEDPNERDIDELRSKLKDQDERGASQQLYDYRNNSEDVEAEDIGSKDKEEAPKLKELKTAEPKTSGLERKNQPIADSLGENLDTRTKEGVVPEEPVPLSPEPGSLEGLSEDKLNSESNL